MGQNDKGLMFHSIMEDVYVKPFGEGAQGDIYSGLFRAIRLLVQNQQHLAVSDIHLHQLRWRTEWEMQGSWEFGIAIGSPAHYNTGYIVTSIHMRGGKYNIGTLTLYM